MNKSSRVCVCRITLCLLAFIEEYLNIYSSFICIKEHLAIDADVKSYRPEQEFLLWLYLACHNCLSHPHYVKKQADQYRLVMPKWKKQVIMNYLVASYELSSSHFFK